MKEMAVFLFETHFFNITNTMAAESIRLEEMIVLIT